MYEEIRKAHQHLDDTKRLISKLNLRLLTEEDFGKFIGFLRSPGRYGGSFGFYSDGMINLKQLDICGCYFTMGSTKFLSRMRNKDRTSSGDPLTIRILSKPIEKRGKRTRDNIDSLTILKSENIEIRTHEDIHARFIIGHDYLRPQGGVIIGSFDFTDESGYASRKDIGIFTEHPDIYNYMSKYFEDLWTDPLRSKEFNAS